MSAPTRAPSLLSTVALRKSLTAPRDEGYLILLEDSVRSGGLGEVTAMHLLHKVGSTRRPGLLVLTCNSF